MSIGRFSTSLVSGVNENSLSLANLSLDLSLIKLEAPKEYTGLGAALSSRRRSQAEEGNAHKTARRLGALFEQILPSTPELIKAYGLRATTISKTAQADPADQKKYGVFANCIGPDATSVWAAATSGASAIAVHLLACILARSWSGPQATSIWAELVTERKRILEEQARDGVHNASLESLVAARQDLLRADLAQWDASARAWLQVADEVQLRSQKQLMLVLSNINLPVNQGQNTYDRVIHAWKTAMTALERLIMGQPQRASNGAALLGLASWHLYPDLLVLGESVSNIKFGDDLVDPSGQLTIGLENAEPEVDEGIYWSLSLSHLRFYGDPVTVRTSTARDVSRLNMDEMGLLALGSVTADWGEDGLDPTLVARFFIALFDCIKEGLAKDSVVGQYSFHIRSPLGWLNVLINASRRLLGAEGAERDSALSIIGLGRRRGHSLLAEQGRRPPPMYGLFHSFVASTLLGPPLELGVVPSAVSCDNDNAQLVTELGIFRMRFIANRLNLRPNQALIRIRSRAAPETRRTDDFYYEYATAVPHTDCHWARLERCHIRWSEIAVDDGEPMVTDMHYFCSCHSQGHSCHVERCACMQRRRPCTRKCHLDVDASSSHCKGCQPKLHHLEPNGSQEKPNRLHGCKNLEQGEILNYMRAGSFATLPPDVIASLPDWNLGVCRASKRNISAPRYAIRHQGPQGSLCKCFYTVRSTTAPTFTLMAGDINEVALFVRADVGVRSERLRLLQCLSSNNDTSHTTISQVTDDLTSRRFPPHAVLSLFTRLSREGTIRLPVMDKTLSIRTYDMQYHCRSLRALALAQQTYSTLHGATVSLGILSRPLYKSYWVPQEPQSSSALTRQQKFACITMLESGSYDLRPSELQDVFAISCRNTIYVSKVLLCDPFDTGHADEVVRVVGNVGRTGIAMMVAPPLPRIRPVDLSQWRQISHSSFSGKAEDCFRSTSAHLSFTEYEIPYDIGDRGGIDNDLCIVETLVSVHDRGKWVADLDVLALFAASTPRYHRLRRYAAPHHCKHSKKSMRASRRLTAIDNWEEFLDLPDDLGAEQIGVVRAHNNGLARLAAACVSIQRNLRTVILPVEGVCWECCCKQRWAWTTVADQNALISKSPSTAAPISGAIDSDSDEDDDWASDDSFRTTVASEEKEYDCDPHVFVY